MIDVPVDDRSVHNPSSPIGQIEQTAAVADRLTRLTGRRREIARWGVVLCFSLPAIVFVISAFVH